MHAVSTGRGGERDGNDEVRKDKALAKTFREEGTNLTQPNRIPMPGPPMHRAAASLSSRPFVR